jgi:ATP-dependent protease Clp ATPase subunit
LFVCGGAFTGLEKIISARSRVRNVADYRLGDFAKSCR